MKVVICWAHISGYMAACWRALANTPGVDLHVIARGSGGSSATNFSSGLMSGIQHDLVASDQPIDRAWLQSRLADLKPDIVIINGWHTPAYVAIPSFPELSHARFIMAMDTPYLGTWRQRLGRFSHPGYFSKLDHVFVTGERCWQLAKILGFKESDISRGVYGVDYNTLAPLLARRASQPGGWPRKFLYTGRYVDDKAIDVLLEGYTQYRKSVSDPWPLTCCGKGPHASMIAATPGVEDRGFVQPTDLPDVLIEHGVFVLASRFDPWPLVIVESCAAGLPIVCTEACGSRVELVRSSFNGATCETDNPASLAHALRFMHKNYDRLPAMGAGSRAMAEPYSAQMWVDRWSTVFNELMEKKR